MKACADTDGDTGMCIQMMQLSFGRLTPAKWSQPRNLSTRLRHQNYHISHASVQAWESALLWVMKHCKLTNSKALLCATQCTQGNPPTARSLQSPLLGGGSMGSKLIYWMVNEEKYMLSTACPPGLSPLLPHGTIILNFSINQLLVETETSLYGFTALTTSNISFGTKKRTGLWSLKRSLYFIALNMTCNLEMNLWTGFWYMLHTAVIYYC